MYTRRALRLVGVCGYTRDGQTRACVCVCVYQPIGPDLHHSRRNTNTMQDDGKGGLLTGRAVSEALVDVVRLLDVRPRFLIAKGGITSNDVATKGVCVCVMWCMRTIRTHMNRWGSFSSWRHACWAHGPKIRCKTHRQTHKHTDLRPSLLSLPRPALSLQPTSTTQHRAGCEARHDGGAHFAGGAGVGHGAGEQVPWHEGDAWCVHVTHVSYR